MGIFKGKAELPVGKTNSDAGLDECHDNGWCFTCGGTGRLGYDFMGKKGSHTCPDCGGSGKGN